MFHRDVSTQIGTMALLPQIVDAVKIPVIAGGIADARADPCLIRPRRFLGPCS